MHIFISVGEPSGDLHGSHLARALRSLTSNVTLSGFGGQRMQEAGCQLLFPLAEHPVMGLWPAVKRVPFFARLLDQVNDWFARTRPELVVLVDNPGFNWWVARQARQYGIPVWYFVPPQLWAWGGWRVRKMRRLVERLLCGFPFEADWFRRRGLRADYIGHPYCDALHRQLYDEAFVKAYQDQPGCIVGLLPGSRQHEVEKNFPTLLRVACRLGVRYPEMRFLVACYRKDHASWIENYLVEQSDSAQLGTAAQNAGGNVLAIGSRLEIHVGRTAEIIRLSRVCAAVSGSVSLELLYHCRPACIVYRVSLLAKWLAPFLLRCRYITLVNLLAGRELFPEFVSLRCPSDQMADKLALWLEDTDHWQRCHQELQELRQRFFRPGACQRAAELICQRVRSARQVAA